MDAVTYIKKESNHTKGCTIPCNECLLSAYLNGVGVTCMDLKEKYPEKAIEIIKRIREVK